jgi:hypothetical protein
MLNLQQRLRAAATLVNSLQNKALPAFASGAWSRGLSNLIDWDHLSQPLSTPPSFEHSIATDCCVDARKPAPPFFNGQLSVPLDWWKLASVLRAASSDCKDRKVACTPIGKVWAPLIASDWGRLSPWPAASTCPVHHGGQRRSFATTPPSESQSSDPELAPNPAQVDVASKSSKELQEKLVLYRGRWIKPLRLLVRWARRWCMFWHSVLSVSLACSHGFCLRVTQTDVVQTSNIKQGSICVWCAGSRSSNSPGWPSSLSPLCSTLSM